ncbi:uncharacterized protein LOC132196797 [Neocloeon triangulifer]|uniref:uncharacterized protein LOC132196797 n=1 Tax=Neocloeon triangulifer TaxID=2078957 RepID=UPI00286F395B|nr:uncharacterized protein LOC132196797 [Neocloeon triangulifer]XP_059475669.1 uncharacterized protein LOC132196797 [Neocloeon triangulifer]
MSQPLPSTSSHLIAEPANVPSLENIAANNHRNVQSQKRTAEESNDQEAPANKRIKDSCATSQHCATVLAPPAALTSCKLKMGNVEEGRHEDKGIKDTDQMASEL